MKKTLLRRSGRQLPRRGDRKVEDLLPKIARYRASGMRWKDVGTAIGIKGSDQKRAVYALNMVQWAKKKGLWPVTPSPPPSPPGYDEPREETRMTHPEAPQ